MASSMQKELVNALDWGAHFKYFYKNQFEDSQLYSDFCSISLYWKLTPL